jgi:hypothetical protein
MMNDRIVSPHRLRALYSFLAIVATVAATKAMVWPSRPVDAGVVEDEGAEAPRTHYVACSLAS